MAATDSRVILAYLQPESLPGYKTLYQEDLGVGLSQLLAMGG